MSAEAIVAIIVAVGGFLLTGIGFVVWLSNIHFGLAQLRRDVHEVKGDVKEWKRVSEAQFVSQLRRGRIEAVDKGVMKENSPLTLTPQTKEAFGADLSNRIHTYYLAHCQGMSEAQTIAEIELKFGNEIIDKVCKPMDLHERSCWFAALAIAMGVDTIDDLTLARLISVTPEEIRAAGLH